MKTNIKLTDSQMEVFKSIKSILEAEREIKPSDLDAIALLAVNMSVLDECLNSLDVDGVMIASHTQYGQVVKSNPAAALMQTCQQSIRALMTELLMTPKSKAMVAKDLGEKVEEEDPLAAALKARAKRGG
ncbi:MAG: P27 family phage terminase small subunit [Aeromonas veronii]